MEILGQKKLTLNNGDEYIRLVGIIRPEDVDSRNIVPSSRIANAKISYKEQETSQIHLKKVGFLNL